MIINVFLFSFFIEIAKAYSLYKTWLSRLGSEKKVLGSLQFVVSFVSYASRVQQKAFWWP